MPSSIEIIGDVDSTLKRIAAVTKIMANESSSEKAKDDLLQVAQMATNAIEKLQSIEEPFQYAEQTRMYERRNFLIPLAPTIIGTIVLALLFLWTMPISEKNAGLKDDITVRDSTIHHQQKRLGSIFVMGIQGLNIPTNDTYYGERLRQITDSLFANIILATDTTINETIRVFRSDSPLRK